MATESSVDRSDMSTGELIAAIKGDLSDLVHDEIELTKAELRDEAKSATMGLGAVALAVILAALAVVLLSFALVVVVNNTGISLGWSFTIVAGSYLVLATICASMAKIGFGRVGVPRRARSSAQNMTKALRPSARS